MRESVILLIKFIRLYVINLYFFFLQFFHPTAKDSNVNLLMVRPTHPVDCIAIVWKDHMWKKGAGWESTGIEAPSMRKKITGILLSGALVLDGKHGSQTPRPLIWSKTLVPHGQFWGSWSSKAEPRLLNKSLLWSKFCFLQRELKVRDFFFF